MGVVISFPRHRVENFIRLFVGAKAVHLVVVALFRTFWAGFQTLYSS